MVNSIDCSLGPSPKDTAVPKQWTLRLAKPDNMSAVKSRFNSWLLALTLVLASNSMAGNAPLTDAEAYINGGVDYANKQQHDEAIADFSKAQNLGLQISPELLKELREASAREK